MNGRKGLGRRTRRRCTRSRSSSVSSMSRPRTARNELRLPALQPPLYTHRNVLHLPLRPQRALPDDADAPAGGKQRCPVLSVALDVARELRLPVLAVARRPRRSRTALVPMPEAAVHETDCPEAWEHHVRPARKRGVVELVAQTAGVERAAQDHLRPGVPASYSRHDARTGRAVDRVRHALLAPAEPWMFGGVRRLAHRRLSRTATMRQCPRTGCARVPAGFARKAGRGRIVRRQDVNTRGGPPPVQTRERFSV